MLPSSKCFFCGFGIFELLAARIKGFQINAGQRQASVANAQHSADGAQIGDIIRNAFAQFGKAGRIVELLLLVFLVRSAGFNIIGNSTDDIIACGLVAGDHLDQLIERIGINRALCDPLRRFCNGCRFALAFFNVPELLGKVKLQVFPLVGDFQLEGGQPLQAFVAEDIGLGSLHAAAKQLFGVSVCLTHGALVIHARLDVFQIERTDRHLADGIVHHLKGKAGGIDDLFASGFLVHLACRFRATLAGDKGALGAKVFFAQLSAGQVKGRLQHVAFSRFGHQPGQLHRLVDCRGKVARHRRSHQHLDGFLDSVQAPASNGAFYCAVQLGLLARQNVGVVIQRRDIGAHLAVVGLPGSDALQLPLFLLFVHGGICPDGIIVSLQAFVAVHVPDLIAEGSDFLDVVHMVQHFRHVIDVAQKAAHGVQRRLFARSVQEVRIPLLSRLKGVCTAGDLGGQLRNLIRNAQLFKDVHGLANAFLVGVWRIVFDKTDLRVTVGYQHVVDGVIIIAVLLAQLVCCLLHHFISDAVIVCRLFAVVQHIKNGLVFLVGQLAQDLQIGHLFVQPADAVCLIFFDGVKDQPVHLFAYLAAPGAQIVSVPRVGVQAHLSRRGSLLHMVQDLIVQRVNKGVFVLLAQRFDGVFIISVPQAVHGRQLFHHASAPVVFAIPAVNVVVQSVDILCHVFGHALFCRAGMEFPLQLVDLAVGFVQAPLCFSGALHFAHVSNTAFDPNSQLVCGLRAYHVAFRVSNGAAVFRRGPIVQKGLGLFFLSVLQPIVCRLRSHIFADSVCHIVDVFIHWRAQHFNGLQLAFHFRRDGRARSALVIPQRFAAVQAGLIGVPEAFLPHHGQALRLDNLFAFLYIGIGSELRHRFGRTATGFGIWHRISFRKRLRFVFTFSRRHVFGLGCFCRTFCFVFYRLALPGGFFFFYHGQTFHSFRSFFHHRQTLNLTVCQMQTCAGGRFFCLAGLLDHLCHRVNRPIGSRAAQTQHQTGKTAAQGAFSQLLQAKLRVGIFGCSVCDPVCQIGKAFLGSLDAGLLQHVPQDRLAAGLHQIGQPIQRHFFGSAFNSTGDQTACQRLTRAHAFLLQFVSFAGGRFRAHSHRSRYAQRQLGKGTGHTDRRFTGNAAQSLGSFQRFFPQRLTFCHHLASLAVFVHRLAAHFPAGFLQCLAGLLHSVKSRLIFRCTFPIVLPHPVEVRNRLGVLFCLQRLHVFPGVFVRLFCGLTQILHTGRHVQANALGSRAHSTLVGSDIAQLVLAVGSGRFCSVLHRRSVDLVDVNGPASLGPISCARFNQHLISSFFCCDLLSLPLFFPQPFHEIDARLLLLLRPQKFLLPRLIFQLLVCLGFCLQPFFGCHLNCHASPSFIAPCSGCCRSS